MHDGHVSVVVIAIAHTAHGADDVLEATKLGAQSTNVDVDGALVRDVEFIFTPERLDDLFPADGLALVDDQELKQFKLFESQRCCGVVNQHALA